MNCKILNFKLLSENKQKHKLSLEKEGRYHISVFP